MSKLKRIGNLFASRETDPSVHRKSATSRDKQDITTLIDKIQGQLKNNPELTRKAAIILEKMLKEKPMKRIK